MSSQTSALASAFQVRMTHSVQASWRLNRQKPIFLPSLHNPLNGKHEARLRGRCPNLTRTSNTMQLHCDCAYFSTINFSLTVRSSPLGKLSVCLSLRSHCLHAHPAYLLALFVYFFPMFLQYFLPLYVGVEKFSQLL